MQKWEKFGTLLLLLLATGAGEAALASPETAAGSGGEPVMQALFALIYAALFLFLMAKRRHSAMLLLSREKWTAALCCWVLASTAWSVEPGETLRRAVALIGTSMAGLYLGMRYEPKQQLRMLATCLGIGAVASLAAGLFLPGVGVTSAGAWQGVFYPKNSLGREMALGALCFLLLGMGQRRKTVLHAGMFLLCCALLLLSRSATAVVVLAVMGIGVIPIRRALLWRTRPLLAFTGTLGLFAFAAGLWIARNSSWVLRALGRDSSLTGRVPLWQMTGDAIAARPALGYGFSAFWTSPPADRIREVIGWETPHAHNGYLDTMLGLGIIGMTLLILSMASNLRWSIRAARGSGDIGRVWPLFFLIFTGLYNLSESSLLAVNSALWMVYVANSFWLTRMRLAAPKAISPSLEKGDEVAGYRDPAYS